MSRPSQGSWKRLKNIWEIFDSDEGDVGDAWDAELKTVLTSTRTGQTDREDIDECSGEAVDVTDTCVERSRLRVLRHCHWNS